MVPDDVVDQQLRGAGQHQAGQPIHHHQRHAERQAPTPRPDQGARFAPGGGPLDFLLVVFLIVRQRLAPLHIWPTRGLNPPPQVAD